MKQTARRNLGLGVSALLMLGLTTIATPAYANGFTIESSAPSIEVGQSVQLSTTAPSDRAFSATVDGVLFGSGYGMVTEFTTPLPWSFFGGCEDVIVTFAVFDQVFVYPFTPTVEPSDFVSVTFVGDGEDCGPVETMTLTGEAILGATVTAAATVPGSLIGNDFDLWVCPDTTIRPDDLNEDEANGACVGPFIQERTGDNTSFLLGFDPVRDVGNEEFSRAFWLAACDKYFIVHDFPGGGHSNWVGPIACSSAVAQLAATGVAPIAGIGGLAAVLLLLVGGGLLVAARRRNALSAE